MWLVSNKMNICIQNSSWFNTRREIARMREREDRVDDLKLWKEKIDEVASPTQLQVKFDEVEDLKQFKTKAITIFTVAQFIMAGIVWLAKLSS